MSTYDTPENESTDPRDEFAQELGYRSLADAPPQVRRNIDASWPNVDVGSFEELVDQLASVVEDD